MNYVNCICEIFVFIYNKITVFFTRLATKLQEMSSDKIPGTKNNIL